MGYFVTLYILLLAGIFTAISVWMWRFKNKDYIMWVLCIAETGVSLILWGMFFYCIHMLMTIGA
jgi:hypothetical protein